MRKAIYILSIIVICLFTVSCQKEQIEEKIEEVSVSETPVVQQMVEIPEPEEPAEPKKAFFMKDYDFSEKELSLTAFHTDAHKEFLDDPMEFAEIPTQDITEGKTAVVASRVCMFYPEDSFTIEDNGEGIMNPGFEEKGIPVPFATIVKLGEKLKDKNPEYRYSNGMFKFQDNWNWFYKTEWNGTSGWVFGADLYGIDDTLEHNRISSRLYEQNGKFESFYPITGYLALEENVIESLENNKLAMQIVLPPRWISEDDMVDCYNNLKYKKAVPIFLTTDLAAHCQHLFFDRMLQYTEENIFLERMSNLTDAFIEALSNRLDAPDKIREQAIQYFQVPQAILKARPDIIKPERYYDSIEYRAKNADEIEEILSEYPEAVKNDFYNIRNSMGTEESIFKEDEDFSQYKPRGHYTKNGLLETYFQAQMWYGHLHFSILKSNTEASIPEPILQKEAVITLIVDTVQKDENLYKKWSELFNPITALIGMSDDLSFDDIVPLWKDQNISDYSEWASNQNNIIDFMSLCADTLRPPAISGQSVWFMYSEPDSETGIPSVPMGWRLFGQRFTYDSFIHEKVSPPRLMSRDIVRGLDIMKVFGSKTADALLQSSDYPIMEGLKEKLDELENIYAAYDSDFWKETYYNQVLYQVKTQANFEQGTGFYFTESPAWNIKSQIAAHGTWAELRHDTILYVKQVVAERAGDGDFEPTFRTEPLPKPVHYVEPNVPFWEGSLSSVEKLAYIYWFYDLLDDESESALQRLQEIYKRLLSIAKTEAENLPVSEKDNDWIPTVSASLGHIAFVHNNNGYIENADQKKMACIADVYTNNDFNVCLEVGVANPVRLYIPLNDSQGGKRIAVGYGFSYVEFTHPSSDRMTDEEWKNIVYKEPQTLNEYMPFWEKECILEETSKTEF